MDVIARRPSFPGHARGRRGSLPDLVPEERAEGWRERCRVYDPTANHWTRSPVALPETTPRRGDGGSSTWRAGGRHPSAWRSYDPARKLAVRLPADAARYRRRVVGNFFYVFVGEGNVRDPMGSPRSGGLYRSRMPGRAPPDADGRMLLCPRSSQPVYLRGATLQGFGVTGITKPSDRARVDP